MREVQHCQSQPVSADSMFCLATAVFFYSCFLAVSTSDSSNCHERDGWCRHHTCLYARTRTSFSCAPHTWCLLAQGPASQDWSVLRASQEHRHLFIMSLLGVLVSRFPLVASSPTCSLSRPSASSTLLAVTRSNTCTSAHWSGMSGCWANPTPHTSYEPNICVYFNDEHTPINLHRQRQEFPAQLGRHHGLHHRGHRKTSTFRSIQQQQAYRSKQSSHSVRIIREMLLETDDGLRVGWQS